MQIDTFLLLHELIVSMSREPQCAHDFRGGSVSGLSYLDSKEAKVEWFILGIGD